MVILSPFSFVMSPRFGTIEKAYRLEGGSEEDRQTVAEQLTGERGDAAIVHHGSYLSTAVVGDGSDEAQDTAAWLNEVESQIEQGKGHYVSLNNPDDDEGYW